MTGFKRIWNGRASGIVGAIIIAASIMRTRVEDQLATLIWRGNLGLLGRGSVIQRKVKIRQPGSVTIGDNCSIGSMSTLSSEHYDSYLIIGDDVIINPRVHLDFSGCLEIGHRAVISENVTIFTHSHGYDPRSKSVKRPLVIENDVWIGANVIITEGVHRIASGTIVASGAIVTRELTDRGVYAGVPARIMRKF